MIYHCDRKRIQEKIETFHRFGDRGKGGVTRLSLSPEALQAREEFVRRCRRLSMRVKTDDMEIYMLPWKAATTLCRQL